MPVHVEGYEPPADPRLNVIKVTPDPGVIEVNVHPAASWREAVEVTHTLYEETRLCRLGTDKFMIDGRHTGTGGGNHVVLGGADRGGQSVPAPARSAQEPDPVLAAASLAVLPVLRPVHRPDQPGPARRRGAPRPALRARDRARDGAGCRARASRRAPWLVDRLFRNLLVDVTGNTHRAELCIDKLFSPDGPNGTARPGRIPLLRNAAARAHEPGAAAALARPDRLVLARAAARLAGALGHRPARPIHARALRLGGLSRRAGGSSRRRLRFRSGLVSRPARVSLSVLRRRDPRRRDLAIAPRARAMACPWRRRDRRRHRALRRFLGRAAASEGRRVQCRPPRRHLQRPPRAAGPDRPVRRIRRRHTLQGVEAGRPRCSRRSRCTRRSPSTFSIAGAGGRSAAASTTSRIPAAATTRPFRSIPTKRRRGVWRASRITAIRRGSSMSPGEERSLEYPMTLDLRRPTHV